MTTDTQRLKVVAKIDTALNKLDELYTALDIAERALANATVDYQQFPSTDRARIQAMCRCDRNQIRNQIKFHRIALNTWTTVQARYV